MFNSYTDMLVSCLAGTTIVTFGLMLVISFVVGQVPNLNEPEAIT